MDRFADIEDLYAYIKKAPRRAEQISHYMTKDIEESVQHPRNDAEAKKYSDDVIKVKGKSRSTIYRWLEILVAEGRIERDDNGIYHIPESNAKKDDTETDNSIQSSPEGVEEHATGSGNSIQSSLDATYRYGYYNETITTKFGTEVNFLVIRTHDPYTIMELTEQIDGHLAEGFNVHVHVLEFHEGFEIKYKYAALFFKNKMLKKVFFNRDYNLVIMNDPRYNGSGARMHKHIEDYLESHEKIKVTREWYSDSYKNTKNEGKDDMDHLLGYLSREQII